VDRSQATDFIVRSLRYDGGFAQCPGMESHGGSTYCAVAALHLMDKLVKLHFGRKKVLGQICNPGGNPSTLSYNATCSL
jgi:prenyltransferase beta subunit